MAAPPQMDARVLHLGFRFEPKPLDVVSYYLPRLIAGEPMHSTICPFIHDTNVYACAPSVLAAQFRPTPVNDDRFFFTTVERQRSNRQGTKQDGVRYVRIAGPGSWTFQRSDVVMNAGSGAKLGEVTKLRYKLSSGVNTDWLMEEYSCTCSSVKSAFVGGNRERVFCRIYVSPNAGADSMARQESAAFFKGPAPPPIVPAVTGKRPAPLVVKPPLPKRIRGAPISLRHPPPPPIGCTATLSTWDQQIQMTRPSTQPGPATSQQPSPWPQKMQQPGRSPAPATQRPTSLSQQQMPSVAHQLPPRHSIPAPPVIQAPRTPRPPSQQQVTSSATPPPVKQAPLAPRPVPCFLPVVPSAPPAQTLLPNEEPAEAEYVFDDLVNALDNTLTDEEAEEEEAATSPDDPACTIGHSLQTAKADDDEWAQFESSLENSLDEVNEEEGRQVPPPQKEVRKYIDPFEAATFADEAD